MFLFYASAATGLALGGSLVVALLAAALVVALVSVAAAIRDKKEE